MGSSYVLVALPLPFKYHSGGTRGLTYLVPSGLTHRELNGCRVVVPLGKRKLTGVVVGYDTSVDLPEKKIREILDVLDPSPVFSTEYLAWTRWIAEYYMSSWGEVLGTAIPEGLKPSTKANVAITELGRSSIASLPEANHRQREILEALANSTTSSLSVAHLQSFLPSNPVHSVVASLEDLGFVSQERKLSTVVQGRRIKIARLADDLVPGSPLLTEVLAELERHAPRQATILLTVLQQKQISADEPLPVPILLAKSGATASTYKALKDKGYLVESTLREHEWSFGERNLEQQSDISHLTLTKDQQEAISAITDSIDKSEPQTFLLHGITGSGKTEVYISAARKVLSSGDGVLILVPEIALTPQLIDRFRRRLSLRNEESIAVMHSKMSMGERNLAWKRVAEGSVQLVIGARSAVFAPIENLKLIIVDEEHEATYKQYDKIPRYNARDIAVVRAAMLGAVAVLGSATPAIESYYNAKEGKYRLLSMTERANFASLPQIKIVDRRRSQPLNGKRGGALSKELYIDIKDRLEKKEGVVLLQNRRGFSTFLECTNCGNPETCPNCAVTLTFHKGKNQLRCHYCGFAVPRRTTCTVCGEASIKEGGIGTERVEEELIELFPEGRILRMDLDTTSRKGAYKQILQSFADKEADILLGTQMVAKGLDFPHVTLVGVISADTTLCLPDFRAAERTFQMLTQVAGRAGRSAGMKGEVLVQTLQPQHSAVQLAAKQDYEEFYKEELGRRQGLDYPPFSRLILLEFKGLHENAVRTRAELFGTLIPDSAPFYTRLGPAAAPIPKLRNEWRWQLLIKNNKRHDPNGEKIRRLLTGAIDQYQKRFATPQVKLFVDVDVQGVM